MREQWAVQTLLRERLDSIRARNTAYSLRSFSRKLGLSSSAVSEILNGKRRISRKVAARIAERLELEPTEASELLAAFAVASPKRGARLKVPPPTPPRTALQLQADQFRAIAEGHHFSILSLAETEDFRSDPAWIARRLGLKLTETREAIARLERLELLHRDGAGALHTTGAQYTTSDEILSSSVRRSHLEDLDRIRRTLEEKPLAARDSTSITIAMDPDQLPLAKRRIREFRDALCQELERGRKRSVYKLCMHFIPLSEESKS